MDHHKFPIIVDVTLIHVPYYSKNFELFPMPNNSKMN